MDQVKADRVKKALAELPPKPGMAVYLCSIRAATGTFEIMLEAASMRGVFDGITQFVGNDNPPAHVVITMLRAAPELIA